MVAKFAKVFCLVGAGLMLIPIEIVYAQDKDQVIVISPKVSETIDREERDRYGLFPDTHDFHTAVILQKPDSSYVVVITEKYRGSRKVRTRPIDRLTLDELHNQIDSVRVSFQAERTPLIVVVRGPHRQIKGKLMGMELDFILLEDLYSLMKLDPQRIHIDEIQAILAKGPSFDAQDMIIGSLAGAAIGAVIGYAEGDDKEGFFRWSAEANAIMLAIPLGLLGGCLGGIQGGLEGKERQFDLSQVSYEEKIRLTKNLSGL